MGVSLLRSQVEEAQEAHVLIQQALQGGRDERRERLAAHMADLQGESAEVRDTESS